MALDGGHDGGYTICDTIQTQQGSMLRFINIHELHARTPQAIRQVERGAKIVVTRRGKPKALLLPLSEDEIEDIVLASAPFKKGLQAAQREAKRKGWRTLAEVRRELGLRDV